jgi:hypothetical protein
VATARQSTLRAVVTDRRDLIRLGALLGALLLVAGVIMFATEGGSGSSGAKARAGEATIDGRVLSVTTEKLVLQPADGSPEISFDIRQIDLKRFDVFHLEQHAQQGLLTRVTFIRDKGKLYAVNALDAPVPGA